MLSFHRETELRKQYFTYINALSLAASSFNRFRQRQRRSNENYFYSIHLRLNFSVASECCGGERVRGGGGGAHAHVLTSPYRSTLGWFPSRSQSCGDSSECRVRHGPVRVLCQSSLPLCVTLLCRLITARILSLPSHLSVRLLTLTLYTMSPV